MKVKKIVKITAISLGSLLLLLIITALVISRIIVTPEKLTPIVQKQAARFITCPYEIGSVELTIFKTFPNVGVQINQLSLINPMPDSPSDTLVHIKECVLSFNLREFIKNNTLIINSFQLKEGFANLFINEKNNPNFDIFKIDDSEGESSFELGPVDIQKVEIQNVRLLYNDLSENLSAGISNLTTSLKGSMKSDMISGKADINTGNLFFALQDATPLLVKSDNIALIYEGKFSHFDEIEGKLSLDLSNIFMNFQDTLYADSLDVSFSAPLQVSIGKRSFSTDLAQLKVKEYLLEIKGKAAYHENREISMALNLESNTWNIEQLLSLIPADFNYLLDGIALSGEVALTGALQGIYNDSIMPSMAVGVKLHESSFNYHELPVSFHGINSEIQIELEDNGKAHLHIPHLEAKTGQSALTITGDIEDLLGDRKCKIQADGLLNLPELSPFLPKELQTSGKVELSLKGNFTLEQITELELEKMELSGSMKMSDLDLNYEDSIFVKSNFALLEFSLPPAIRTKSEQLLSAVIESGFLTISMVDLIDADLKDAKLNLAISDFLDTTTLPFVDCSFQLGDLWVEMDTLSVKSILPNGEINLRPSMQNPLLPDIRIAFNNSRLQLKDGAGLQVSSDHLTLKGQGIYDDRERDFLLQWSPHLKVDLKNAIVDIADFPLPVEIPNINFDFSPGKFDIEKSNIVLGNSHFSLSGLVTNMDKFLDKTGLLTGDLEFVSDFVDVNQLMDLFNGFGTEVDSTQIEEMENPKDQPFMVPNGIDLTLKTGAKKALFRETELFNLIGQLTVKDGILVLEEMGFTSEAAVMQLTAMYRTPRMNHLFAGIDFHLLDVDIDKLLEMTPFVDDAIPMLNSFDGNAEFHFAIETYLKSNYDIKFSTLRGAMAISGDSLVLLDSETFSEISKMLMFSKKSKNVVDSLSVEMTIFKDEIDIYPFEIAIDKYKAVLSGRHTYNFGKDTQGKDSLTHRCNYHVSITDTPLPLRLGLNITGDFSDLKFKLAACQYPHLFRPNKQRAVDKEILRLKKIISDSLEANVKPMKNE